MLKTATGLVLVCLMLAGGMAARGADGAPAPAAAPDYSAAILTPPAPATPRINGPSVFGVRPEAPFQYAIPATGERPMTFGAAKLPRGLKLDAATGIITGKLANAGEFKVVLSAKNAKGEATKNFRIVVGDKIALTPAMGWNSWNCWAEAVDQQKVISSAKVMIDKGLANHGWTYINIDDTWQGKRTGKNHALLANEKFPDMKGLCDAIHKMGLKPGIYSTPWITSYAKFPGGSSDNAEGIWTEALKPLDKGHQFGKYSFAKADAAQWAAWGFDYLKYDWNPNDVPHTREMSQALRATGRDFVFSLSNSAPFANAADWAKYSNSWRTTSDIYDKWAGVDAFWQYGASEIGFSQDRWIPFAAPGHWNDPDMLVVGMVGWGKLHATHLTADEQYSHITLWCMLSAPLLIGCDMERLDPFTLNLLTNDEVLAIDQDALGKQAARVATWGPVDVYAKDLEDGSKAVAFFNRDSKEQTLDYNKIFYLGYNKDVKVRDLWRQKDLPVLKAEINKDTGRGVPEPLKMTIPSHGVMLYKMQLAGK